MTDLRTIRRTMGLSQTELADKLGLHQTTISRLESGALPIDQRTLLAVEALQARADPTQVAA